MLISTKTYIYKENSFNFVLHFAHYLMLVFIAGFKLLRMDNNDAILTTNNRHIHINDVIHLVAALMGWNYVIKSYFCVHLL